MAAASHTLAESKNKSAFSLQRRDKGWAQFPSKIFLLLMLAFAYLFMGGAVFSYLESGPERNAEAEVSFRCLTFVFRSLFRAWCCCEADRLALKINV